MVLRAAVVRLRRVITSASVEKAPFLRVGENVKRSTDSFAPDPDANLINLADEVVFRCHQIR